MNQPSNNVYVQAMQLSAADRARLAGLLLESLDDDGAEEEGDVDAAWRAEVTRRMDEMNNGTVAPVSWEQVKARLLRNGAPE